MVKQARGNKRSVVQRGRDVIFSTQRIVELLRKINVILKTFPRCARIFVKIFQRKIIVILKHFRAARAYLFRIY